MNEVVADDIISRRFAAKIAAEWEAMGFDASVFDDAGIAWQWWKKEWLENGHLPEHRS